MTRSIVPTESALADRCGKGRPLTLANVRFWHFGDISLLRILERYLRQKSNAHTSIERQQRHPSRRQA